MPTINSKPLEFNVKIGELEFSVTTSPTDDASYTITQVLAQCYNAVTGEFTLVNIATAHTEESWNQLCLDLAESIDAELVAEAYKLRTARMERMTAVMQ